MSRLRGLLPFFLFGALASLFLWKVAFGGQVFVPAHLLRYLAPWTAEPRPPWNPLMYDSVGQFYPWRHFASEAMRSGVIPLWNPHQFSGTPFVANSQSAVLYPGNLLFYLLPTAHAAGWSVVLHLALAGGFTMLLLRGLGLSRPSAALGGIAFAFSTWQVSWLHLPTFLATSCWLPLVLHATLRLRAAPGGRRCSLLALSIGMTLLAGHLQIAFYVLLAAALLAIWPRAGLCAESESPPVQSGLWARASTLWLLGATGGLMLALPQVLPSLELSKRSHRTAPASAQGYEAYVAYAVSPVSLATLALPDIFGNPSNPERPYTGKSKGGIPFNYAEGAMYVGIPTLLLACLGLLEARKRSAVVGYAGALAALAMLMALGTTVDALLYFYVPGFAQSGSPGRALVLWAFGMAVLAAFGCDEAISKRLCLRGALAAAALAAGVLTLTAAAGIAAAEQTSGVGNQAGRACLLLVLCLAASLAVRAAPAGHRLFSLAPALLPLLLAADLFSAGIGYNPTAAAAEVYPRTALVDLLTSRAGHDRIAPINPRNFSFAGPSAVLPPNGAMVFGLRDVQGYDSLFPGQYKAFMNALASPADADASPPEVGNMVFAKNPSSPLLPLAGTRLIVSREALDIPGGSYVEGIYVYDIPGAPGRARIGTGTVRWLKDETNLVELEVDSAAATNLVLADQRYPGWRAEVDGRPAMIDRADGVFRQVAVPAGLHRVTFEFQPVSFRLGLYAALIALAAIIALLTAARIPKPGEVSNGV